MFTNFVYKEKNWHLLNSSSMKNLQQVKIIFNFWIHIRVDIPKPWNGYLRNDYLFCEDHYKQLVHSITLPENPE